MREVSWHCPFAAQGKARARSGKNGWYTPSKTVLFERNVAAYAREAIAKRELYFGQLQAPAPWTGPIELEVEAVFSPPKSWSQKKRAEKMGRPHCQKPDSSNIAKAVEDALNAVVYRDDCQAYDVRVRKWWGERAGFRVTVREVAS